MASSILDASQETAMWPQLLSSCSICALISLANCNEVRGLTT